MAFELIDEGSRATTAVAVQAGTVYTTVPIAMTVKGVRTLFMSCAFGWAGVVGGDSGSVVTLTPYGSWTIDTVPSSAYYTCTVGLGQGASIATSYALTIGTQAAGAVPFYLQGCSGATGTSAFAPPSTPYIWFKFVKSGTGTLTAGTITVYYKLFGDTR